VQVLDRKCLRKSGKVYLRGAEMLILRSNKLAPLPLGHASDTGCKLGLENNLIPRENRDMSWHMARENARKRVRGGEGPLL
jgi:hypothetical protein